VAVRRCLALNRVVSKREGMGGASSYFETHVWHYMRWLRGVEELYTRAESRVGIVPSRVEKTGLWPAGGVGPPCRALAHTRMRSKNCALTRGQGPTVGVMPRWRKGNGVIGTLGEVDGLRCWWCVSNLSSPRAYSITMWHLSMLVSGLEEEPPVLGIR
jgi:hypothetical protein